MHNRLSSPRVIWKVTGKTKQGRVKKNASRKASKKKKLPIHRTERVSPAGDLPAGSRFKGLRECIRQELIIRAENVGYLLERWQLPDGSYRVGRLPDHLCNTDFGPVLKSFVLYQYHHCHVTQPLLLEQLEELGICISSGQLSRLLTEGHQSFHAEKQALLEVGKQQSEYLQTDDTGARHQGKTGYCTFIGNEWFSYISKLFRKNLART